MKNDFLLDFVPLNTKECIWEHFYTVASLVVVGSRNKDYDLAPKHMVTPIGLSNYFGFVCSPKHTTYQNIKKNKKFTVSFVKPTQVLISALAATPRCEENNFSKEIINYLPIIPSKNDNLFIADSYVLFECNLFKIVDGFDGYSIITGEIERVLVNKKYKIYSDIDEQKHIYDNPLLAYIAQGRFSTIKNTYSYPFPKDFQR